MQIAQLIASQPQDIVSCSKGASMREAAQSLADKRIGAMPVFDGGQVAGVLSERDILYGVAAQGGDVLDCTVGECMTSPAVTISSDMSVISALGLMTRRRIRHLPVVDDGELKGFVSIGDLVKVRMDEIAGEAEAMREYIATA